MDKKCVESDVFNDIPKYVSTYTIVYSCNYSIQHSSNCSNGTCLLFGAAHSLAIVCLTNPFLQCMHIAVTC